MGLELSCPTPFQCSLQQKFSGLLNRRRRIMCNRLLTKRIAALAVLGSLYAFPAFAESTKAAADFPPWADGAPMGMMHGWGGGGYGMGPGMMHGWGGGYGMGSGMMHGWGGGYLAALDLSAEQEAKIDKIRDETRRAHWALMGNMMDLRVRLRDLIAASDPDKSAIAKVNKELFDLQQTMLDSSLETRKRIEAVLTPKQQETMRGWWRRSW
jgi:Spy/CpxP family protein refolding chaperone